MWPSGSLLTTMLWLGRTPSLYFNRHKHLTLSGGLFPVSAGPAQAESLADVSVRRYRTLSLNFLPVLLLVEGVFPGVSITGNSSQWNLTP